MKKYIGLLFTIYCLLFTHLASAALSMPSLAPLQPIPQNDVVPYYKLNINTENNTNYFSQQSLAPIPDPDTGPMPEIIPPPPDTYVIDNSSNTTTPPLSVGDVVLVQQDNSPPILGIVTAPLTETTISINNIPLDPGTYDISLIASGSNNSVTFTTGANAEETWVDVSGTYTAPVVGDIVLLQSGTNPAIWAIVTNASSTNQSTFAINGAKLAPSTTYTMTKLEGFNQGTTKVDVSVAGKLTQGLDFEVGDWVIADTGNGYVWGIVTTAEHVPPGGKVSVLRINGGTTAPLFRPGTQVSKFTPSNTASIVGSGKANSEFVYWILLILGILGLSGMLYWVYRRFRTPKAVARKPQKE